MRALPDRAAGFNGVSSASGVASVFRTGAAPRSWARSSSLAKRVSGKRSCDASEIAASLRGRCLILISSEMRLAAQSSRAARLSLLHFLLLLPPLTPFFFSRARKFVFTEFAVVPSIAAASAVGMPSPSRNATLSAFTRVFDALWRRRPGEGPVLPSRQTRPSPGSRQMALRHPLPVNGEREETKKSPRFAPRAFFVPALSVLRHARRSAGQSPSRSPAHPSRPGSPARRRRRPRTPDIPRR